LASIINSTDTGSGGLITTGDSSDELQIQTAETTAITVDSGQRTKFPTTIGVGGATPSTSGSGISFPATQSASTNANTLDDYEEGTWTPEITATTGTFTTTSASNGTYTIIGRVVQISVTVTLTTIADAAGALVLTLPISAASTSNSGNGAEVVQTGFNCQVWTHSTSVIRVRKYDFTTPIQQGNVINISLTYTI
jgi:hypothetical protein